jgi:hypothetical protein
VKPADPAPNGAIDIEIHHRAEIAALRMRKLEPAVCNIARHLAVAQRDQLSDFFIQESVGAVAGRVRRKPKRLAIDRSEDAFRRNVIAVLAVTGDKIPATEIAKAIIARTRRSRAASRRSRA